MERAPAWTIRGVELDGDAPSLAGPYHLSGRIAGPGGAPIVFRLVSETAGRGGRAGSGRGRGGAASGRRSISMGSSLSLDRKGPNVAGAVTLSGTAAGSRRDHPVARSRAARRRSRRRGADPRRLPAGFRGAGASSRGFGDRSTGAGRRGSPSTRRQSRRIVDALLRRKGEDAVPPVRAATVLAAALAPALAVAGSATLDARLAVDTAILGGGTRYRARGGTSRPSRASR